MHTHVHSHTPQIALSQARATKDEDKALILDYIVKGNAKLEERRDQQLQFLSNTLKLFFILDPLDFKMDLQQAADMLEEGERGYAQGQQQQQQQQQQPGSSSDPLFDLSAYSAWLSLEPGHANYRSLAVYGGAGSGAGGHRGEGWVHCSKGHTHLVIRLVVMHHSSVMDMGASHRAHRHACPYTHHLTSSAYAHVVMRFMFS